MRFFKIEIKMSNLLLEINYFINKVFELEI